MPDNAPGWPATWAPPTVPADRDALVAEVARLRSALREIETICTESAADCRKRMGTRVGNALTAARAALADTAPRGGDGV